MLGMKLEAFPAPQEEALLLMERVGEAQRFAAMEMRSTEQKKKKGPGGKRGGGADDADGGDHELQRMVEQARRGKKLKTGRK